jgi:alanine-glyoxylate transaminase/serine-glyoxylate transaminase/serine-pyruvate transaminase
MNALAMPTVGHLDPVFQEIMEEVKQLLRYVFRTGNEFTIPISGTGSAGMEAAIANALEPSDRVLIAVKGYFGERMVEMAGRYGAQVDRIDRPWGEIFEPDEIEDRLKQKQYKAVAIVHGETSTGVVQTHIKEIADAAHRHGALLILDTVASLAGADVRVDEWGVDICYSGSQKCLSAPPGLAPITLSERAIQTVRSRKEKVTSWYLDLNGLDQYWHTGQRAYHHTAPVNLVYALRESLRLVLEEDLDAQLARHRAAAEGLWEGLEALGLPPRVPLAYRNPTLTTPELPSGLDELAIRKQLMQAYNIEISGGFGPLAGKIWRIGLMGYSARMENVVLLLAALERLLK